MSAPDLPPDWTQNLDPSSGKYYYSNALTGESAWVAPQVTPAAAPAKPSPPPKPKPSSSGNSAGNSNLNFGASGDSETRLRVLEEMILTEASYNSDLGVVVDVFIKPIKDNEVLTRDQFLDIFGDWESLRSISDLLYKDLTTAVQQGQSIATVFTKFAPFFKTYGSYLKNYDKGVETKKGLLEKEGGHPLDDFLLAARSDPRCHGLDLGSFLIMPVQRIPRYKLLLDSLLKETPEGHPDRAQVLTALNKVAEVATHNNAVMAKSKTFDELLAVQLKFGQDSQLNLLDVPTRVLLKEGTLAKLTRKGKGQPRAFWLFNDKLIYGEATAASSQSYSLHLDVNLRQCVVTDAETVAEALQEVAFQVNTSKKSFIVCARTKEDARAWRSAITDAIETLQKRVAQEATGSSSSLVLAPKWITDAAAPACMVCGEVFTIQRRRHHCRACGDIICVKCGKQKLVLPHIDPVKPFRVCDPCGMKAADSGLGGDSARRNSSSSSATAAAAVAAVAEKRGTVGPFTSIRGFGGAGSSSSSSSFSFSGAPGEAGGGGGGGGSGGAGSTTTSAFLSMKFGGGGGGGGGGLSSTSPRSASGFMSTAAAGLASEGQPAVFFSSPFLDALCEESPEFASIRNGYQQQALKDLQLCPALEERLKSKGSTGILPRSNPPSSPPPPPPLEGAASLGGSTTASPTTSRSTSASASKNPFSSSGAASSSSPPPVPPRVSGEKPGVQSTASAPSSSAASPPRPPPKKPAAANSGNPFSSSKNPFSSGAASSSSPPPVPPRISGEKPGAQPTASAPSSSTASPPPPPPKKPASLSKSPSASQPPPPPPKKTAQASGTAPPPPPKPTQVSGAPAPPPNKPKAGQASGAAPPPPPPKPKAAAGAPPAASSGGGGAGGGAFHPFSAVCSDVPAAELPPGVDPAKREAYLSPSDFEQAFSKAGVAGKPGPSSIEEFSALPAWKRKQLKEKARLF